MSVHSSARILPTWHKVVPVAQGLECIMDESNNAALFTDILVGVVPILTSDIEHLLTVKSSRLVEGGNDRYDIGIIVEFSRNLCKDPICAVDIGLVRVPAGEWHPLTRVIEPVLTSRGTVEIDDDLEFVFRCPADRLNKVVVLSLDIRFTGTDLVGPISYWDAHVVESGICDCTKVILGDPCIPMVHQYRLRRVAVSVLSKRPLVHDAVITRIVK